MKKSIQHSFTFQNMDSKFTGKPTYSQESYMRYSKPNSNCTFTTQKFCGLFPLT